MGNGTLNIPAMDPPDEEQSKELLEEILILYEKASSSLSLPERYFECFQNFYAQRLLQEDAGTSPRFSEEAREGLVKPLLEVIRGFSGDCLEDLEKHSSLESFFNEYPLLFQKISYGLYQVPFAWRELLAHLKGDESVLADYLGVKRPLGQVKRVEAHMSLLRWGYRGVHILEFAEGRKVVYKTGPRAVEKLYSKWVNKFREWGLSHLPKAYWVLEKNSYAWAQFVEEGLGKSIEDSQAFFRSGGNHLFFHYILRGHTIGVTNYLQTQKATIPIDQEMLFQPQVEECFLNQGLRPSSTFSTSNICFFYPSNAQTLLQHNHESQGEEKKSEVIHHHLNHLLQGFEEAWKVCLEHRDEILAPGGLLEDFCGLPIRSYAPEIWAKKGDFSHLNTKENLRKSGISLEGFPKHLENKTNPYCPKLPLEILQAVGTGVWYGCYPDYEARSDSLSLGLAGKVCRNYWPGPNPYVLAKARLSSLNQLDLHKQIQNIRAGVYALKALGTEIPFPIE